MLNKKTKVVRQKEKDDGKIIFPCECNGLDHVVELEISKSNYAGLTEGYLQLFLNRQTSFFKRLVIGFKYIFKLRPSSWYEIDGTLLDEHQLIKLQGFLNKKLK